MKVALPSHLSGLLAGTPRRHTGFSSAAHGSPVQLACCVSARWALGFQAAQPKRTFLDLSLTFFFLTVIGYFFTPALPWVSPLYPHGFYAATSALLPRAGAAVRCWGFHSWLVCAPVLLREAVQPTEKEHPLDMKAQMQTEILRVTVFTAVQPLHTTSDSPEPVLHALACRMTNSELS